jgi:hypothetical protein
MLLQRICKPLLPLLSVSAFAIAADIPAVSPSAKQPAATTTRTTLLVPMPLQDSSWQDMAFLAAVPAATVVNNGDPSLVALDTAGSITPEITDYAVRYRPDEVIMLGGAASDLVLAGRTCKRIAASSAEEAARKLSERFWPSCRTAVICAEDDYESAVVAAALAARLRAPLLFTGTSQMSEATTREILRLKTSHLLVVGHCADSVRSLKGDSLQITKLAGALEVMAWAKEKKLPVRYLAALNPLDRDHTVIRKLSLAGVLLAAGRDGLVAPLAFETRWKIPFSGEDMKGDLPANLPKSEAPPKAGKITLDGLTTGFLLTGNPKNKDFHVYFDLNGDGGYTGSGEGPFATGDTVELANKRQVITLGTSSGAGKADVRLSWPPVEDVVGALRHYYEALVAPPGYLCLIGFPDAIPQEIRGDLGMVEETTSDLPYANADDDHFAEIGVARVIAENVSFATLFASRVLTYPLLLTSEWQDFACQAQWENTYDKLFENVGFKASYRHTTENLKWEIPPSEGNIGKRSSTFSQDSPLTRCAVITHMDHSWWHELGSTFGWDAETLLAPVVVESGGCLTAALDREPDFRSVIARLFRKGAVSFVGNAREGCAPQELQRMEFWTGVLAGQTLGQAHRQSINSALVTVLDKEKNHGGAYGYQLHIRTLFGDPAFRMRVPGPPQSTPAKTTVKGETVTIHAPAKWWPVKIFTPPDWKLWAGKDLHVLRGAGTYALREWCGQEYDREETCITAEFTTRHRVARIEQVQNPPAPLGMKGTWHADHHTDGSTTYRWAVRVADFDQIKGLLVNAVDHLDYHVVYE